MTYNTISGCIPDNLPSSLYRFEASYNLLGCPIPETLPSIGNMNVMSNRLNGTVPATLPASLYSLSLGWNDISGEFPYVQTTITFVELQSTRINGTLHLKAVSGLYISSTDISTVVIDDPSLMYCDMRNTNITNPVNDPTLVICDRSTTLQATISDCDDVVNLAYGLNLHISSPLLMQEIEYNCCSLTYTNYVKCNTTNVIEIHFNSMNLDGTINGTAIPRSLQRLYLPYNSIYGPIPDDLPDSLIYIQLEYNQLSGIIPRSLPLSLDTVYLNDNWLSGSVPDSLPTSLKRIRAQNNYLTGSVPSSLPPTLQDFYFDNNLMDGTMPVTLPLALVNFDTSYNYLHGSLPAILPSALSKFKVDNNYLNGSIPAFPNSIFYLHLNDNKLTGQAILKKPYYVYINHNRITNITIIDTSILYACDISSNPLLASKDDADLTKCTKNNLYINECVDVMNLAVGLNLDVVQPDLMASIETNCCSSAGVTCASGRVDRIEWPNMNLNGTIDTSHIPSNLTALDLSQNSITGPVPEDMPSSLVNLTLHSNKLSGVIPSDLPLSLEHLDLSDNMINGSIPTVIPTSLLSLLLNKNKLSGSLPSSIPSGLVSLDVSNNNLSGPVPDLSNIEYIYLNRDVPPYNQFTGGISVLKPKELYVPNNLITNILINDTQQLVICNITNNPLLVNANDASLSSCVKDGLYNQSTSYFTSTMGITSSIDAASSVSDTSSAIVESTALLSTGTLGLSTTSDYKDTLPDTSLSKSTNDYKEILQSVSVSTVATLSKPKTGTTAASTEAVLAVDESLESILRSRSLRIRSRQQSAMVTTQYYTMGSDITYSNTLQPAVLSYNTGKLNMTIRWTYFIIGRCVLSVMVAIAVLYYTPFIRSIKGWRLSQAKSSKNTKESQGKAFGSVF